MNYYEFRFNITPNTETNRDVLAAILADVGFESFTETENGIDAYVPEKSYDENTVGLCVKSFPLEEVKINYSSSYIETKDWNEEWEKNFFQPIIIENKCVIHSSFHHDIPQLPYDIVIDPKMAFGTGHHETTSLMLTFLLETDVRGKSFLDMGCGTAVLAILAKMRDAGRVVAIDIDEWAYNNALENIKLNNTPDITVLMGDASLLGKEKFDIIYANINRNILLNDIHIYAANMNPGAELYMSGFYREDLEAIKSECSKNNLQFHSYLQKNNWVAARFTL